MTAWVSVATVEVLAAGVGSVQRKGGEAAEGTAMWCARTEAGARLGTCSEEAGSRHLWESLLAEWPVDRLAPGQSAFSM